MSFQDMAWAVEQKCASPGQKLVLLMLANHCNGHTKQCNPSHKRMADECSMGISTLKRHIASLAEAGLLVIEHRANEGVSLPNQYRLNPLKLNGVGPNRAGDGSELDGGVGPNRATKQEVKPRIETTAIGFASFWSAYPKKTAKPAALKAFKTAKVSTDELILIVANIASRSASEEWLKDGGQFIPHPSTYLNQRRWEDGEGESIALGVRETFV